jgi:DNA-directed RNA polymerase specialized sigma24 family protein
MQDEGSTKADLRGLNQGDPQAIERLWGSYFERLVGLARTMLPGYARRVSDEEDVALSAFHSLCKGAAAGRFPKLDDRDDLWRLLVVITFRKARRAVRQRNSLKRGGHLVQGESAFMAAGDRSESSGLAEMLAAGPTPELAAEVAEQCERLLQQLGDDELRTVALLKMDGYTVDEIATKLSCARRSIERRLQTIRSVWDESATTTARRHHAD